MQVRQQKWRAALGKLCGILRLQPAIQDAAPLGPVGVLVLSETRFMQIR